MEATSTALVVVRNAVLAAGTPSGGASGQVIARDAAAAADTSGLPPARTPVAAVLAALDHYEVLGLPRRSGAEALAVAYRRAARLVHPDKCGDAQAEEAFNRVQEAFVVLSDPELRRFYDDELHGAKRGKVAQTQAGRVAEEQRRQACRAHSFPAVVC